MASRTIRDEWLLATLETILPAPHLARLRESVQDSYWETALRLGVVADAEILEAIASRFRMKIANLAIVTQQARELVPESLARKYRVLPLSITDSVLDIATADPHDLDAERALAFATGRTVRMALASPQRIAERIEELYRPENAVEKILEGIGNRHEVTALADVADDSEFDLGGEKAAARPIIQLVDHILAEGITSRASDIHLEPEETGMAVRCRIDGVLRQVMTIPRAAGVPLVSRVKIMSGLDIADRLRPQDGRARVLVNGNRVDLRVSTLPASNGEKVVIRILDQRATVLSLDKLGLNADEQERLNTLLGMREGIVLVTGPTGSGKTTTLYSTLKKIQEKGGINIVTVEDPVEYRLQGIVQVQVNEKAGLTFSSALRSILRQDPDVVLVGEIRDKETAQIAVQASLTGHLVFSTLHTNDAASSVTRLLDIGIESYKIASALKGIVAQRLLRRLCNACKVIDTEPVPERLQRWVPHGTTLYRAVGCAECSQTGYRGRMAIVEVLITTPEVERRISANDTVERIAEAARQGGMRGLWDSGLMHVRAGETGLEELQRVVEVPSEAVVAARGRPTPGEGQAAVRSSAPVVAPRNSGSITYRNTPVTTPTAPHAAYAHDDAAFQLLDEISPHPRRSGHTVLLVEDEDSLRRVLRDLLEREGLVVVEARDGVEALDQVDRIGPDLIVLDLNLPRLDGYAVLTHLRARPSTANLPVLVLTAKGDEDNEVRVFEYGANDFLQKPFRPRALAARLRAMLRT